MNEADFRKVGEQIGEYLSMGIAGGLVDNSKEAVQAFRGLFEKLKYQRDFDLISEEDYYKKLEELRDRYFEVGTDNWVRYTEKIYSYQKRVFENEKKEIQSMYDDIADYATEKLDEVIKKQENLANRLNDSGSFFKHNKVIIGDNVGYYYSLGDMDRDIEAIKQYGLDFGRLSRRLGLLGEDAGSGILERIKGMDLDEALGVMRALLAAEGPDFKEYVESVDFKEKLSQNISAEQYEKELSDAWDSAYSLMKEKLAKAGYEIPEDFSVSGTLSAQKFGQAFIDELDLQLAAVRERIDEFNSKLTLAGEWHSGGNVYNTSNTSYNITAGQHEDIVDYLRRNAMIQRFMGIE